MSYAIDANILLYASDSSSPVHPQAIEFLRRCASRDEVLYLTWPTLMAYLRIATHPAIFDQPLDHARALSNVEKLCALPHVQVLHEGEGFLDVYRQVSEEHPVRGNLVADASLACLLRSNGVRTLYTCDRGFRRFDFLKVKPPW